MSCLADSFHRPVNYLRVSVTDRCNLRCVYCMPPEGIPLLRHEDILSFEEIYAVIKAAAGLGVKKVRFTGGEPLVRLHLADLIRLTAGIKEIDDISLTTNGILLAQHAKQLKAAGLNRVNISLDSLVPERFTAATRGGDLNTVLKGIEAAREAGLNPVKLNFVVMGGFNDDEIPEFARKTVTNGWHVRFIERMPFTEASAGGAFIPISEIKTRLEKLGPLEPAHTVIGNGPAKYFRYPGAKGTIGFITPVSEHFCYHCNRLRLTADGKLRPCLLSSREIDVKQSLRLGVTEDQLQNIIKEAVAQKPSGHHMTKTEAGLDRPFSQIGG